MGHRMTGLMLMLAIVSTGQMVVAFNIEPVTWRQMAEKGQGFGYKVIQHNQSRLLVSAPLEEFSVNQRGKVYDCKISSCSSPPGNCSCTPLPINAHNEINMSLGLWMNKEEVSPKAVVCGPTIPKECEGLNLYGGMCFSISESLSVSGPVPPNLRDCPVGMDIAFLLDGSGSVAYTDFRRMKQFVINLIDKFIHKDTQFAVAQFSTNCRIEINFDDFKQHKDQDKWKTKVQSISQDKDLTYTAEAINKLMRELFIPTAGNRLNAKKVLLVITDGASNGKKSLAHATNNAHQKNVICYAIGVGNYNMDELRMIASKPESEHVFTVTDFSALDGLKETLENNIIAIEGTQTSGDSTQMEFAQEGFSAALTPSETFLMSAVGAYQWKGMYEEYSISGNIIDSQKINKMEPESYMGYSMAVAMRRGKIYVILGAPRYKHSGQVVVHHKGITKTMESEQIGSYFGAEVCVVDLDGDSNTDLILASAPMQTEEEREGKVFVYKITEENFDTVVSDTGVSLLGIEHQRGRFGSSLASLADLNGDTIRDVAVGAPLEDNRQGSVYIFNGRAGGINPKYSQRITGSSVRTGLQFFGLTVARSALDQSGDGLPDIAVGSKEAVLLLRSRPIVSIMTSVRFDPMIIPTSISDCTDSHKHNATVCFTMAKITKDTFQKVEANLNYTLNLDYARQKFRAFFKANETDRTENKVVTVSLGDTRAFFKAKEKDRTENKVVTVSLGERCFRHHFIVQCSPEDIVNPVDVQVTFSFKGNPILVAEKLKPKLASSSSKTTDHKLNFEIDCGQDKECTDNIHLNFNFSGSSILEVGITQDMNVTVMVENRGENSYNTRVSFHYPHGLSYRTFTKIQGRVECRPLDSTDGATQGKTDCSINRPILRTGHKVIFVVQYGINGESNFDDKVTIQAQATSDNNLHDPESQLSKTLDIGVQYSIHVILRRFEDTTKYINFTAGNNNLQKPVTQTVEVTNSLRGLNLTVVIHVPVRLQGKDIWTNVDSLQIQGCTRGREMSPGITDLQQIFKNNKEPNVNCSIAVCLEFRCSSYMKREDQSLFNIPGNVSSGWIEKTGLRSALFHLTSSATLEYDNNKYIFYSSDSSRQPPITKIETLVEVYEEPDVTKEIIGGVVGGLLLLALMTAGLAKSGFFKSEYQQKLEKAEAEAQEKEQPPEGE